MTNEKIVCASPEYLSKHKKPTHPEDLLVHNCIVFGENKSWEFKHKETDKLVKIAKPTGNIRCDNGEIIKELILEDLGLTVKSSRDCAKEIKEGKIIVLLKDYEVINKTKFYAVFPAGKYRSPNIEAFIKFFQEKLKNNL